MAGLSDSRHWVLPPRDDAAVERLIRECSLPSIVARTLVAHGLTGPGAVQHFLSPSLERDWHDPLQIPGMGEAADRVERAITSEERIAVFGDFDVDGMSATCLLTLGLRHLGAKVWPYIPHRFEEGYGLSKAALDRVIDGCHPDLVITVDNGIAAKNEVEALRAIGIDVVITDHHEPADLVPVGVPVTDPKLSKQSPSRELAGAGVALKLVQELGRRLGQPDLWRHYTEVATLGTISDMMLLDDENRALVSDGIENLRKTSRPGIVALAARAGINLVEVTSDSLPFSLIPRLNAAGRMGCVEVAFDLLVTNDPGEAAQLADQLEQVNDERREIESQLTEAALAKVEASYHGGHVIVVGGEGWHEGVKGIVASRIVNRYHVPAILFSINNGIARGSGRSVGSVDLFHAVEQCSDLLIRFGGHAGAVGVTCDADKLDELRERLDQILGALPAEQFESREELSGIISLGEIDVEGVRALDLLQPFGQGNRKPLFAARGLMMRNRARVGAKANHLRFVATDGVHSVSAIMFRAPDIDRAVACEQAVDLVFEAVNETWQGKTKPKLMVRDIIYRSEDLDSLSPSCIKLVEDVFAQGGMQNGNGRADLLSDSATEPMTSNAPEPSREQLSQLGADRLTSRLRETLIGDHELLSAQNLALGRLAQGHSTLCVMATGRGKSLIFHLHAAREALLHGRASIFVYPLRALAADQAFHLNEALAPLGLRISMLTGETTEADRQRIFSELDAGETDIILTTPEFLAIHVERFAASSRIGFVVIDEAHHAGRAKSGSRSAYLGFPQVLDVLGNPTVLAVTATADDACAREICRLFSIDENDVVVDDAVRDNLSVVDCRNLRDREDALISVIASGEKTIVYVNSRGQTVSLARMLRKALPDLGHRIAFYNAGLSRRDRSRIEHAFRSGQLCCIISTSAFGEGVNLPSVRNVVLYHLPFGATEFNQMSGRAGRDGEDARIHLLFGARDARINERIMASSYPDRQELVTLYRTFRRVSALHPEESLSFDPEEISAAALTIDADKMLDANAVESGASIFEELGFLRINGYGDERVLSMKASPAHVDLERSVRYLEGIRARQAFGSFRDWVLDSSAEELLSHINRPIVPDFGVMSGSEEASHG